MSRTILHSDLNAFYASVEMLLNPTLQGKAVAVCGSEEDRHGIVLAKSELAKKAGVKTVQAKYVDGETVRRRLESFKRRWHEIKARLEAQLVPSYEIERSLRVVGAPVSPEEIGSTVEASLADVHKTVFMRDRYMALDFLLLTGQLDDFAKRSFVA